VFDGKVNNTDLTAFLRRRRGHLVEGTMLAVTYFVSFRILHTSLIGSANLAFLECRATALAGAFLPKMRSSNIDLLFIR
jgi:hypothetical protein